jgi:hypothetical protein
MKKMIGLLVVALFSVALYGQKTKVESGSLDFMKAKPVLNFVFSYDNTNVGKMSEADYIIKKVTEKNSKHLGEGDEWREQYMHTKKNVNEKHLIHLFGIILKSKGVVLTENPDESAIEVHVNVDFLEPGFNAGGFVSKAASMNVTCRFLERATGNEMARVLISNASTDSDVNDNYSVGLKLKECYGKCGKELASLVIEHMKK